MDHPKCCLYLNKADNLIIFSNAVFSPLSSKFKQEVVIGDLKPGTLHRVSVGAYGWAGKGRPSIPSNVTTLSQGTS